MSFYTIKELNIKLLDFTTILSPLGVVKRILSNGDRHLFEINFHNKIPIYNGKYIVKKETNIIDSTLLKLFFDTKLGLIINETSCILEIPNLLEIKSDIKDIKIIGKNVKKTIIKDLSNIFKDGYNLKNRKITDPQSINLINFNGFQTINV